MENFERLRQLTLYSLKKKEKKKTYHDSSSLAGMEIENNDNLLSYTAESKGKNNTVLLEAKRIQVG